MIRVTVGVILLLILTVPAQAQWGHHGGHGFHPGGHGWGYHGSNGFWGGVVGGLIGGLLTQPRGPEWPQYCYNYRSFNPQTGYWIGYDGVPRFCQ